MEILKKNLSYKLNLSLFAFIVFGSIIGIKGAFFLDELYLSIFIILYSLLIRPALKFKINFFIIFLLFLLFKSLILIKLDFELKYLRYCVLYLSLLIFFSFDIKEFIKKEAKIIILTLGSFLIILNGLLLDFTNLSNIEFGQIREEFLEGDSKPIERRFWSQSIFIVGSTYFSIICIYLLYLISLVNSTRNTLIFLLIVILGHYYNSRFINLACLLFFPFFIYKKNIVYLILSFFVLFFFDYVFELRIFEFQKLYFINYTKLLNFEFNQDQSRIDDLKVAIEILLSKDFFTITFGMPFQSHKYLLGEYFSSYDGIYRTSSLPALIIDTGIFGLVILIFLFIETFFRSIYIEKNYQLKNIAKKLILFFLLILNLGLTYALENVFFFYIIGNFVNKEN